MATGVWGQAQALLREAADTIEARSAGRDESGRPDTIAIAAQSEGLTVQQVLAAMIGIKRSRHGRGGDRDSAVDLLAYEARRLVATLAEPAESVPNAHKDGHAADGAGLVLAEAQFEAACSGPALNHAGGDIAE